MYRFVRFGWYDSEVEIAAPFAESLAESLERPVPDPKLPESPEPKLSNAAEPIAASTSTPATVPGETPEPTGKSGLIGRVLPAAIKLWLRSQLEHIDTLELTIGGGDRQILSGHVPQVHLQASGAVYQGIHLTQADMTATGIRVNLGQILRGKPLRLLNIVPVQGTVSVSEADLNASVTAPLLAKAVSDFLVSLLLSGGAGDLIEVEAADPATTPELELEQLHFQLQTDQLTLTANLKTQSGTPTPLTLRTGLAIQAGNTLILQNPTWLPRPNAKRGFPLDDLDGYAIALGEDVNLTSLALSPDAIALSGTINVIPVD